jgi:molybdopterin-binding protein
MLFRKKIKIKRRLFRRIINYFIGTGVALIVISLVAFGYTQTSSFRNWLKDFLVEQVNSSTNGKLTIEQLNGTIFTSLILSNTSYVFEKDTLLSAEKIELKVSPLRILLKTIFVRKLEIENADISLLKDENGVLNLSKITNPTEEKAMEETVTETEPFNWKVNISELNLKKINFRHQSYVNRNSTAYYSQPEMDDLRLENLNLSLTADINIAESEYQLYISEFSANPNLTGFKLLNLTGNFILLKDMAGVTDLKIITEKDFVQKDDITENQTGDASSQDSHGTAVLSLMAGYDPGKLIGPAFGANIILAKTENVRLLLPTKPITGFILSSRYAR